MRQRVCVCVFVRVCVCLVVYVCACVRASACVRQTRLHACMRRAMTNACECTRADNPIRTDLSVAPTITAAAALCTCARRRRRRRRPAAHSVVLLSPRVHGACGRGTSVGELAAARRRRRGRGAEAEDVGRDHRAHLRVCYAHQQPPQHRAPLLRFVRSPIHDDAVP